jgi:uncharacterized membrane protein
LLVGAMIATAMSANVFFWIIPGQKTVVAAMTSGQPYDADALAIHGKRGKQRSVHNTYFTLPVIVAMLSNHYSFLYTAQHNWVVLFVLMFAGALIRQFFVQRHGWHHGRASNPWPFAAVGVVLLIALIVWMRPAPSLPIPLPSSVSSQQIQTIMEQRCVMCHGATMQSKGIRLDSSEWLQQHAQSVYQQTVVTRQMPMNNATGITEEERAQIASWFLAGTRPQ